MTIGIFDSGIGGLGIFQEIKKLLPDERILYLADTANCPYGKKSEEEIKKICLANSKFLIDKGADIIVVACNTASTVALQYLRSQITTAPSFPFRERKSGNGGNFPVVGVVPVVKTCSEVSKNKRIGILATKRTVESKYLRDLIEKFCPVKGGFKVYYVAANPLVELVENCNLNSNFKAQIFNQIQNKNILNIKNSKINSLNKNLKFKIKNYRSLTQNSKLTTYNLQLLRKFLENFRKMNVDTVALGCTHFPFLRVEIEEILGPRVRVLDSNGAVARQVKRITDSLLHIANCQSSITNNNNNTRLTLSTKHYSFYASGDPDQLKTQIKNLMGLKSAKVDKITIK